MLFIILSKEYFQFSFLAFIFPPYIFATNPLIKVVDSTFRINNNYIKIKMNYKEVREVIKQKKYKQKSIQSNKDYLNNIFTACNQMQFKEDQFKIIRILIRYFRFPSLILFREFYSRLGKNLLMDKDIIKNQKKAGSLVNVILAGKEYPCLNFYFRVGFNELQEPQQKQFQEPAAFREFIHHIDNQIYSIGSDDSNKELARIKRVVTQLQNYQKKQLQLTPIFILCIEAYQQLAKQKKKDLQSSISFRSLKSQDKIQKPLNNNLKITIQTSGGQKQISDGNAADPLCCRQYFYINQLINEPETITQQYKNYNWPFSKYINGILLKTIVGFLNVGGGIIYIGIKQYNDTKKRIVTGQTYNQSLKEEVLKHIRYLGQRISPDIVNNQLYKLQFVPLKEDKVFLPGKFIIRLKISQGELDELYSYKNYENEELCSFRTENQVLVRRLGQEILQVYRKKLTRIKQPYEKFKSNHEGPCKKPDNGKPLYQNQHYGHPQPKWASKDRYNNAYKQKKTAIQFYGFIHVGKGSIPPQLQKYGRWLNKKPYQVFQTDNSSDDKTLIKLVQDYPNSLDFLMISSKVKFQQSNFNQIYQTLDKNNNLFKTSPGMRTFLLFQKNTEAISAACILYDKKIDFQFVLS